MDSTKYRLEGIFWGVKFSWMLGFVVIRGKKFMVKSSPVKSKPHRQWPLVLKWKL